MAQATLTPKRISALTPIDSETDASLFDNRADKWVMAIDSIQRSNAADRPEGSGLVEGTDKGSLKLPMSRIALRDDHGKIPANMLPGHIDDMLFGEMIIDKTTEHKATFIEHWMDTTQDPPVEKTRTYVSPSTARTSAEYEPPENAIYVDSYSTSGTPTEIQYRYVKANEANENLNYGFTEVPGSRAIVPGYGVNVTYPGNTVQIEAKRPQYLYGYGQGSRVTTDVNNAYDLVDVNRSSWKVPECEYMETVIYTQDVANGKTTFSSLHADAARYQLVLEFMALPVARSGNIVNVCLYDHLVSSNSTDYILASVAQMDMSGPYVFSDVVADPTLYTKAESTFRLVYEFTADDTHQRSFSLTSEEPIRVRLAHMYLTELI